MHGAHARQGGGAARGSSAAEQRLNEEAGPGRARRLWTAPQCGRGCAPSPSPHWGSESTAPCRSARARLARGCGVRARPASRACRALRGRRQSGRTASRLSASSSSLGQSPLCPPLVAPRSSCRSGSPRHLGKVDWNAGSEQRVGAAAGVGVPRARNVLKSWSISDSPVKSGLPVIISAKMQPADQSCARWTGGRGAGGQFVKGCNKEGRSLTRTKGEAMPRKGTARESKLRARRVWGCAQPGSALTSRAVVH